MTNQNLNSGYGFITLNDVGVCHTPKSLMDVLQQVADEPFCEVFSTPTFEEADMTMRQRYPQQFFRLGLNQQHSPLRLTTGGSDYWVNYENEDRIPTSDSAMSVLPLKGNTRTELAEGYEYGLQAPAVSVSFWAISFAQGFAVHSSKEQLLSILTDPKYIYAHAIKCATEQAAAQWAAFEYATRFYRRYYGATIYMPLQYLHAGECFIDLDFEAHEATAAVQNHMWNKLRGYGLW